MNAWTFNICVTGYGDTPEAAWVDAVDTIIGDLGSFLDPTDVPDYERSPDDDLEEDEEEQAAPVA